MARQIEAYKLRTEITVDASKGRRELQASEKDVDKLGQRFTKLGKEITTSMKGADVGKRFGSDFNASATSIITGSIQNLGQTIGTILGTAIAPGLGTAIGGTAGSLVDTVMGKISGPIIATITAGIDLNKEIEKATVHFTAFGGSAEGAAEHLKEIKELSLSSGLDMRLLIQGSERLEEFNGKLTTSSVMLRAAAASSIVFGNGAEGFDAVANALGYITEKGNLTVLMLRKLERSQGLPALGYLAKAAGVSEKQMEALIKAGKIKGDVAAQIIAESTIRYKGPRAAAIMGQTLTGQEARFGTRTAALAQEGTVAATQGLKDAMTAANQLMSGPEAEKFVQFINDTTGKFIGMVKTGIDAGLSVSMGLANGIESGEALTKVTGAVMNVGNKVVTTLEDIWEMKSPSKVFARLGASAVEGLAYGSDGQGGLASEESKARVRAALEQLLSSDPRIKAMLDVVAKSEGADYTRAFGSLGHVSPDSFSPLDRKTWPGQRVFSPTLKKMVMTHPYGRYQVEPGTFKQFSQASGITSLDPHSQDLLGVWLLKQVPGALEKVLSGDAAGAMKASKGMWESFAINSRAKTGSLVSQFNSLSFGGSEVSSTHPMPVDIIGGASSAMAASGPGRFSFGAKGLWHSTADNSTVMTENLTLADAAIVNVTDATRDLIPVSKDQARELQRLTNATSITLHPIQGVTGAITDLALTSLDSAALINQSTSQVMSALRESISMRDQFMGAVGQAAGFLPQQQTGKKRGWFSKILGFAAPFLSLIPGVGGILSQIAGIGSQAAAGNWAGVATGIAGGFSANGAFTRGAGAGTRTGATGGGLHIAPGITFAAPHRAFGGPVRRGQSYVVGEHRPELFSPDSDGWIHPRVGGQRGGGDPLTVHLPRLLAVLERQEAALSRLEGVPAGHIVRQGIREAPDAVGHGLTRAMDNDAGLIRKMGQRMRLS